MRALRRNRPARSGFLRASYRHCSRSRHWRVQPLHVFRTRFSRPAGFPRLTSVSAIPYARSTSIQDVAADVSSAQIAIMPLRHGERIKSTLSEVGSSRSCGGDDLRRRAELDLAVLLVGRMTTRLRGSPFNLDRRAVTGHEDALRLPSVARPVLAEMRAGYSERSRGRRNAGPRIPSPAEGN